MSYIGIVREVIDKSLYVIKFDVPGGIKGATAFPFRGELDEPRVGNIILVTDFDDSDDHSYYLYQKLKENSFIGIRSQGKMIKMTSDSLVLAVYDDSGKEEFDQGKEDKTPGEDSWLSWIKLDKSGNITIRATGNVKIESNGTTNIDLDGTANISGGSISIKGPGSLTVNASGSSSSQGPFWNYQMYPEAPSEGTPGISTNKLILE